MNTAWPRRVSLISALGLPTILSPTIGATIGDRPAARRFGSRLSPALQASSFARRLAQEHRLSPEGLPDFGLGSADHSVSNHRCHDRGPPGCPAIWLAPIARFAGFVFRSKTRPSTPTESSSRRLSSETTCVTDWSFSFRCSPPRIAATQLRFDTARLFTAQKRTSTALSHCPLRRTSADFRLEKRATGRPARAISVASSYFGMLQPEG